MKYTINELSEMTGWYKGKFVRAIKLGELKSTKIGMIHLIDKADFVEWWKHHPTKTSV